MTYRAICRLAFICQGRKILDDTAFAYPDDTRRRRPGGVVLAVTNDVVDRLFYLVAYFREIGRGGLAADVGRCRYDGLRNRSQSLREKASWVMRIPTLPS